MRPPSTFWALVLCAGACGPSAPRPPELPEASSLDPAVANLLQGKLDEARAHPDDGTALGELGLALEANELWGEAATSFEGARALQPEEPHWEYHLAIVLGGAGRHAEALELLRRVTRALPDSAYVAQRLGEAALTAGAAEDARAAFEHMIALAPDRPEGLAGLGAAELALGRTREAVAALERAVALDPGYKNARYRLGLAYRAAGRLDEAERELATGLLGRVRFLPDPYADRLRRASLSNTARLRLALEMLDNGRPDRAVVVLEGLRKREPENVTVLNDLAIALQRTGDLAQASVHLEEAARLEPGSTSTWINLARLALDQNTSVRALECAERALALEPRSAKAHLVRGEVLLRQGRRAEALEAFEQARRSDPRESEALTRIARLRLEDRDLDAAAEAFGTLAEERPHDPEGHLGLAEVALARDRRDEALRELELARGLAPGLPAVLELARKLGATSEKRP